MAKSEEKKGTPDERLDRLSEERRALYEKLNSEGSGDDAAAGGGSARGSGGPAGGGPQTPPWQEPWRQWQQQWQEQWQAWREQMGGWSPGSGGGPAGAGSAGAAGAGTHPWQQMWEQWQAYARPGAYGSPGGSPFGSPFGAGPFGTGPFGASPFGGGPFGASPFAGGPFGANPFGGGAFGGSPFGAQPWSAILEQVMRWFRPFTAAGAAGWPGTSAGDPSTGSGAGLGGGAGIGSGGAFGGDGSEPLVALKKSGGRRPLFLVAPIFGSAFPYHHLALHLDDDQPVYGLQSPSLHGGKSPETVPEVAASYVRTIRRRQPSGPYFVGGHSFGGWAAFEIAQQLREAGEDVAFVGIIGTCAPPALAAPFQARAMESMAELWRGHLDLQRDTSLSDEERASNHAASQQAAWTPLQRSAAANAAAALRYLPRPYEGGLCLFLTADFTSPYDHTLGWWLLCTREIDVQVHSGNHLNTFVEPHVQDLARHLEAALRDARQQSGDSTPT